MLRLGPLMDRLPSELSGGERQRVAMGRAIVRRPRVFLFDEPLSNLDAALRQDLRIEIGSLVRELGVTAIYVTHDQVEAMTLADRICVMQKGRVLQIAPPREIYEKPATSFVATFLGTPRMNLIDGRVDGDAHRDAARFACRGRRPSRRVRSAVVVGVRPEDVHLAKEGDAGRGALRGRGLRAARRGDAPRPPRGRRRAARPRSRASTRARSGAAVHVTIDASRMHLFDGDSRDGKRLA